MSKKVEDICRLCGEYKKLSFEHIPPRKAFNDRQILFQTTQDLLKGQKHTKFRRGVGKSSLCEVCNNNTGGWYGDAFVEWTRQGLVWYEKLEDKSWLSLPYYIKPLRVLKQILVMAVAMASERTLNYHYELRQLLLNKEAKYLPPKYRVYAYFNIDGQSRFASDMLIVKVDSKKASYVEAEVSLPPFGYCVTTNVRQMRSLADYQGLYDITWFSQYSYDDWEIIYLKLPARETHEPLPLDYRSKKELEEHYKKSQIQKP